MHKESPERLGWSVARLAKGLVIVGWPITVGAVLLAHGFRFVYNYDGSEPIFRVLSLGIVFMFVNNAFIGALSSTDRQSSFTWASLWSMVVNVGLNVVLIPFFGAMGAACATVLTEVALGVFGWILTARHLSRLPLLRMSWKPVLAGLVMGAALYPFWGSTGAMLVVSVVGGALVYSLVLLALRPFDSEEWQLLRQALRVRS
jgi:O-antigen/teichoic acid export membrane protein